MHKDRAIKGRQEAIARLLGCVRAPASESIAPALAAGRVLSKDVHGVCDVPEMACSRRDGYALLAEDVADASYGAPVELPLNGLLPAEAERPSPLGPGTAVRVLTGGPVPSGADCVLPDEQADTRKGKLVVSGSCLAGKHVLFAGDDFSAGELIAEKGELVTPQMAAVMVRSRVVSISVQAPPKAAVFVIGSELSDPYDQLGSGRMPADNAVLTSGLLKAAGFEVVTCAVLPDEAAIVQQHLAESDADLLVTTGGTGRSERDVARAGVQGAGFQPVFHGVDIRPGKGMFAASRGETILLGLPGPPGAVFACLHAFLPAIASSLQGQEAYAPTMVEIAVPVQPRKQGEWIVPCTIERSGSRFIASPLVDDNMPSFVVLARAQGVIVVPYGPSIGAGELVEYLGFGL